MDYEQYFKYRKTPEHEKRERRNTARFLTTAEMLTAGHLNEEQTAEYMSMLRFEMGGAEFTKWLAQQDPPLDERTDEEIRSVIFTRLQSELMK